MECDDQALVERMCEGDPYAFREFVECYKRRIYYLALDLTGVHEDAEDLSQEVFIKTFRAIHSFRGAAKVSTWLYRITVNTFIDRSRKKAYSERSNWRSISDEDLSKNGLGGSDSHNNPETAVASNMIKAHIEQALDVLSPQQRSAFVLRYYQNLQLREVASTLGVAEGTVKSLLFRAIRRLQKELRFYRNELGLEELQ